MEKRQKGPNRARPKAGYVKNRPKERESAPREGEKPQGERPEPQASRGGGREAEAPPEKPCVCGEDCARSPAFTGEPQTDKLEISIEETEHKTPHSHRKPTARNEGSNENVKLVSKTRNTPVALLSWPQSDEIWQNMVYKEEATLSYRDADLFDYQPNLSPRMRAILLDWIMEVSEVYRLRRVTYYLAVDYIDRYLTIRPNLPKSQLQLLGITSLFIAAKMEEVYPPKLREFAYVCDGACTSEEILEFEILILCNLAWDVNPTTPSGWLNLYMQIHYKPDDVIKESLREGINHDYMFPQYSGFEFVRASLLMDMFSLDSEFLRHGYSTVAAAAMYFSFGKPVALDVSGFTWDHIKECVEYMSVFGRVVDDSPDPKLKSIISFYDQEKLEISVRSLQTYIPRIMKTENHSLQTHYADMDLFEAATELRLRLRAGSESPFRCSEKIADSEDDGERTNGSPIVAKEA